jgi:hypothetical protein
MIDAALEAGRIAAWATLAAQPDLVGRKSVLLNSIHAAGPTLRRKHLCHFGFNDPRGPSMTFSVGGPV